MKKILMAVLVSLVAFTACENYGDDNHKFDNVVYLDVASTSDAQLTTFSNTRATYDCALQAVLTYPAGQDVAVTLTVDPSLVGTYNALRYGVDDARFKILFFAVRNCDHSGREDDLRCCHAAPP